MPGPVTSLDVSADGTIATDVARNPKQGDHVRGRYRVLAAERGFSRGRHEWSVRIVRRGRFLVGCGCVWRSYAAAYARTRERHATPHAPRRGTTWGQPTPRVHMKLTP